MKLLLTSSGLTNKSIIKALADLLDKPLDKTTIAFIPTAANIEGKNKGWLIDNLVECKNLVSSVDIVDISALPKEIWQPRLEYADVLLFGGGNSFHLMYWIQKSGLQSVLPKLLETKIYVGISAGSNVATKNLKLSNPYKREFSKQIGEDVNDEALGYVDFLLRPHLNVKGFPHASSENVRKVAKTMNDTIYAIDDETAIKVDNDNVSIISEGKWEKFN